MYKITVIPGDGIGPEVMEAALFVLEASNVKFDYVTARAGNECFKRTGTTIPDETISTAKKLMQHFLGQLQQFLDRKVE